MRGSKSLLLPLRAMATAERIPSSNITVTSSTSVNPAICLLVILIPVYQDVDELPQGSVALPWTIAPVAEL